MKKLITAYRADKSLNAAQKIRAYEHAHPFCRLMLSIEDGDLVAEAIHRAEQR